MFGGNIVQEVVHRMKKKSFLHPFFYPWWKPVIFLAVTFAVFAIGGLTKSRTIQHFCSWVFLIGLIVLLVSLIYQLVIKDKQAAVYTGLTFGATLIVVIFYGIFLALVGFMDEKDGYADDLKIPNNIKLNIPLEMGFEGELRDSLSNIRKSDIDFQLYNSFQPGLYEYDVWINKIEQGTIYLKAFEITQDDQLSEDELLEKSSLKVYNDSDSLKVFGTTDLFTIYEGDWGKPYAARFELWFKPANGGQKRKLLEKNYKIEGWMR